MNRRWLIPFASMMLLWWLVAELNHSLAAHGIYFFVGGLLVTFAALRLSLRHGLLATLLAGLAIDAVEPVPFGTHLLLFATIHVVLYHLRTRFPREELVTGVVSALFANLALFLALSALMLSAQPAPGSEALRLLVDLVCSQVLVAGLAPWFFALQQRALELGRVSLADERRF